MRLISCQIVNFGCLSNCFFNFDEGLTLIYAENGRGKSTFAAFLKAMLYGLPSGRKGGAENERRRYTPWQGGTFGGVLCFEAEGNEYRLERFFGAREREDRFALYHIATGNPSTRYTENVGEELFGVDADGFERSLYISQTLPFLPPDNNSIRARLGELIEASDDLGRFEKADEMLDAARRHYHVQGERGFIPSLTLSIREKEEEILAARAAEERAAALTEERSEIEAKKKEVAAALDDARTKRAEAEKRRLWDEQNASYTSLLEQRDLAKQQLTPLEAFFAPHLPTDDELFDIENAATEEATLAVQIQNAVLSPEDTATLDRLVATYGEAVPSGVFMERLHNAKEDFLSATERMRAAQMKASAEKDPLLRRFANSLPTEGELAAIRAAGASLEEAQALLYAEDVPKERGRLLPLFPAIGGGILLVLAIIGFVISLLPLAIPALILALGALGVSVWLLLRNRNKPSLLQGRLEDHRVKQKRLDFLLSPFGYTEKDPLFALSRFEADLKRYAELLREEEIAKTDLAQAEAEEQEKRATLVAVLGQSTVDPAATAVRIESDVPVFRMLLQKKEDLAHRRAMLSAERERCSRMIVAFLSHYPSLADLAPRAALDTVKNNRLLSRQALDAHNKARARVANYLQNTRFDPDAPPPPYTGDIRLLEENELSLQKALTELEALSSVKESERAHAHEIALTIPTLIAEREALEKEKAEAEHTLSLILITKDIMAAAKEDLSTRYLRNMEMHFDRYYQKIREDADAELPADGSRVSSFTMDTSLALSCEAYGERRPVSVLSRGEKDLASFCARLALLESIFTKETPFLLFDDPFINLDDPNYEKATRLIAFLAERFQIVYTVCSTARLPSDIAVKEL